MQDLGEAFEFLFGLLPTEMLDIIFKTIERLTSGRSDIRGARLLTGVRPNSKSATICLTFSSLIAEISSQ